MNRVVGQPHVDVARMPGAGEGQKTHAWAEVVEDLGQRRSRSEPEGLRCDKHAGGELHEAAFAGRRLDLRRSIHRKNPSRTKPPRGGRAVAEDMAAAWPAAWRLRARGRNWRVI